MDLHAVARRVVKSVVGPEAWQFAFDVKKAGRKARAQRTRRLAPPPPPPVVPTLTDDEIVAQAKKIEADRKRREWERTSTSLTELAKHFRTDKWGGHSYTPHYQRHLEHLRTEPVRLLEIGIGGYRRDKQGGASLRMWKHFFPKGEITGVDIEDKKFVEEDRIRVYVGDQTDPELLHRMNDEAGPFDVIVDDGSHRPAHIAASFAVLFPLLADNGIYVVEDTQTSYWPEWGGSEDLGDPATSMSMLKRLCDGLNYEEFVDESYEPSYTDLNIVSVFFYHNLVFIQKGTNKEGTRRRNILRKRYEATAT